MTSRSDDMNRKPGYLRGLLALIFLLIAAGSLGPGSFFLQADTAHYHVNAADLALNACWGTGGKPGVSLILAAPYALFGPDPLWDVVLLAFLGAVTVGSFFSLLTDASGSRRWALLGGLWFISLPAILYFTRYHLGYPLVFFVLGLLLYSRDRYAWSGLAFGVMLTAHPTFGAPMAAFLGWSILLRVLRKQPVRLKSHAKLLLLFAVPILVAEGVFFLFLGEIFSWSRGILGAVSRKTSIAGGTTWTFMWHEWRISNGWMNAVLLLAGLAYPLVRRSRAVLPDSIYLGGWSVVAAYVLYTGLTHRLLVKHATVGLYPLLAVSSTLTLTNLYTHIKNRLRVPARTIFEWVAALVVALALPVTLIDHALDANLGSRTAYHEVGRVVAEAAEEGLPVRYFGNQDVPIVYGLIYGVPTNVNEPSLELITGDTRAVLIFEGTRRGEHTVLSALKAEPEIDATQYRIAAYPHRVDYGPTNNVTRRDLREGTGPRDQTYVRARDAKRSELEVWWPEDPQGTYEVNPRVEPEEGVYVLNYPGQGCASTRRFGEGDKNFYHILLDKAGELLAGN